MFMINKESVEKNNNGLMSNVGDFFSDVGNSIKTGVVGFALATGITTTAVAAEPIENKLITKPSVIHLMSDNKIDNKKFIEDNIKKIKEFEAKYDISKISSTYCKNAYEQNEQILNSNLKELLPEDKIKQLEFSNNLYQEMKELGPEAFQEKYKSKEDLITMLESYAYMQNNIYDLIENYNKNVLNKEKEALDITYGINDVVEENLVYNLDGSKVFPSAKGNSTMEEEAKLVKEAIVENNPLQTIENLMKLDQNNKVNLFSIVELETIQDLLDMKQIYLKAKESGVSEEALNKIQTELNMSANEVFSNLSNSIGYQTGVDLQKEMTNMNIYESYNEIKEMERDDIETGVPASEIMR